jgi:hypothetical protein
MRHCVEGHFFPAVAVPLVTSLSATAPYDAPNAAYARGDLKERPI